MQLSHLKQKDTILPCYWEKRNKGFSVMQAYKRNLYLTNKYVFAATFVLF